VNKQSNLSEYFDVSAGMGAYVPKKRHAYTSKRLQDVVADFRKQQKSGSSAIASQHESEGSDNSVDEYNESTSRKKRKVGQKGPRGKGKTNTAATRGRRPRTRGKSKNQKAAAETEDEPSERSGEDEARSTPRAAQLRPRPRPAYKAAKPGASEVDSQEDESY
jgi:DNA excision repair protein ERCC-5